MQLTPYGGVGQIGGNKILLEEGQTRIWLDFGATFNWMQGYYVDYMMPRSVYGLLDYFEFDLLPQLPGLYREELIADTDLPYESPSFQAAFLSHAHWDHVAHVHFLDPGVPVWLGETSASIMEVWRKVSPGFAPALCAESVRTFRTGQKICFPDLEVYPVHVDHSVPGAYGFIISTAAGPIVYSGDLRAHGPAAGLTEDFIQRAASVRPLALIMEGTRVGGSQSGFNHTEDYVLEESARIAREHTGLVIADFRRRDFDRLRTFYRVAEATHRILAITLPLALLLHALRQDPHLADAGQIASSDRVRVYFPRKKSDYTRWEEQFWDRRVTAEDLRANPGDFLWCIETNKLPEMISVRPAPDTPYIHSLTEFFSEEDPVEALKEEAVKAWVHHFQLKQYQLHASGHAPESLIRRIVQEIGPRYVIPIHTQHPEVFAEWGIPTLLPELEQPLRFDSPVGQTTCAPLPLPGEPISSLIPAASPRETEVTKERKRSTRKSKIETVSLAQTQIQQLPPVESDLTPMNLPIFEGTPEEVVLLQRLSETRSRSEVVIAQALLAGIHQAVGDRFSAQLGSGSIVINLNLLQPPFLTLVSNGSLSINLLNLQDLAISHSFSFDRSWLTGLEKLPGARWQYGDRILRIPLPALADEWYRAEFFSFLARICG